MEIFYLLQIDSSKKRESSSKVSSRKVVAKKQSFLAAPVAAVAGWDSISARQWPPVIEGIDQIQDDQW